MPSLDGCLVLVVEEAIIAINIADTLEAAGAKVHVSSTLNDALQKAEMTGLTAAIIVDHALQDGITTSNVCSKLKERNVPFVVYSGYTKIDRECTAGELVQTPVSAELVVITLSGLLAKRQRTLN